MPLREIADGSLEQQKPTQVQQPSIFAKTVILGYLMSGSLRIEGDEFWQHGDPNPAYVHVGFSLGEYAAKVLSGKLSLVDGAKLLKERANLMGQKNEGGLMVVFGPRQHPTQVKYQKALIPLDHYLDTMYQEFGGAVSTSIKNRPGKRVIGGSLEALKQFRRCIKNDVGKVVPLPVSGAFHTETYRPEGEELEQIIMDESIKRYQMSEQGLFLPSDEIVMANVDAQPHEADDPKTANRLGKQVWSPVQFEDSVSNFLYLTKLKHIILDCIEIIGPKADKLVDDVKTMVKKVPIIVVSKLDELMQYRPEAVPAHGFT